VAIQFLNPYARWGDPGRPIAVHSRSGRDLPPHRPQKVLDREEVVRLRRQGRSYRQIAESLGLGVGTVVRTLRERSKGFVTGIWNGGAERFNPTFPETVFTPLKIGKKPGIDVKTPRFFISDRHLRSAAGRRL